MIDAAEPRWIRIPGTHLGAWDAAGSSDDSFLAGDRTGLRFAADPVGPLRIDSPDGSLGRLTLPRGLAIDSRLRVYLLDRNRGVILSHDPECDGYDPKQPFRVMPGVGNHEWSGSGGNPRRFARATSIAIRGDTLYVTDAGSRRVLGFALDSWTLQDVWSFDRGCPVDLAVHGADLYILTAKAIYRHLAGQGFPQLLVKRERQARTAWRRLAIDREGLLYVRPKGEARLLVFDRHGRPRQMPVMQAATVRDRFALPAVYAITDKPVRFVMAEPLTRSCGRTLPTVPRGRSIEVFFSLRPATRADGFLFDRHGRLLEKVLARRSKLFWNGAEPTKRWVSRPLDSKLYDCRWDTVALTFGELPAGALVEIDTYTANDSSAELPKEDEAWARGLAVTGPPRDPTESPEVKTNFLVDSPPGRYLWFRVRFRGDGFATPVLSQLSTQFPRRSYLEHLPAVFSEDEAGRRFLERFLAVFQAEWEALETRVENLAEMFDVKAVRDAAHVDYLASWLGVDFNGGLDVPAKQRLLERLPETLFAPRDLDSEEGRGTRRGTRGAIRDYVAAVLAAVADAQPAPDGFPFVIDGYRDREYRLLAETRHESAAADAPLFGPAAVGRFQLGVDSRLDEARLLPGTAPELDVFAEHAHRFRVVVPATWVPTAAAEGLLRRAIDGEKPAHTRYELQLVRPGLRVGVQSTLGVDTILGDGDSRLTENGPRLGADASLPPRLGPTRTPLDAGLRLGSETARL